MSGIKHGLALLGVRFFGLFLPDVPHLRSLAGLTEGDRRMMSGRAFERLALLGVAVLVAPSAVCRFALLALRGDPNATRRWQPSR